jgi:hypothetical protein
VLELGILWAGWVKDGKLSSNLIMTLDKGTKPDELANGL